MFHPDQALTYPDKTECNCLKRTRPRVWGCGVQGHCCKAENTQYYFNQFLLAQLYCDIKGVLVDGQCGKSLSAVLS